MFLGLTTPLSTTSFSSYVGVKMRGVFDFIVPVRDHPTREELKWAWKFTVLARANGNCQHCGGRRRLDCAHIKPRRKFPALEFDPDNGLALCRRCHTGFDHRVGTRKAKAGWRHTPETIDKMRERWRLRLDSDPAAAEQIATMQAARWNERKTKPLRNCEGCGATLSRPQLSRGNRFCTYSCCQTYRVGKPRSGY